MYSKGSIVLPSDFYPITHNYTEKPATVTCYTSVNGNEVVHGK
jgi:hypothetical protein